MRRAILLGGTGVIGQAVAWRLLERGWAVELCARRPENMPAGLRNAGASFTALDRSDGHTLSAVLAPVMEPVDGDHRSREG